MLKRTFTMAALLTILVSILMIFPDHAGAATLTGEKWKPVEITLIAADSYVNPYKDVDVNATFSGPNGENMTMPAFWDGGSTWKIRFAPVSTGTWTYSTSCTNNNDAGLHGRSGTMTVSSYSGNQDIYKRGFLKRSSNNRYLTYDDGTPFFWLGDTHWFGLTRESWSSSTDARWTSQFKGTVDKRAEQGYNVYQTCLFANEMGDVSSFGTNNEGGFVWGQEGYKLNCSSTDTTGYQKSVRKAFDGKDNTFWAASDGTFPQWIMIDLKENTALSRIETYFTATDTWRYRIEGSTDGLNFNIVIKDNTSGSSGQAFIDGTIASVRYVRLTITGSNTNKASIKEVKVFDSAGHIRNNSHRWVLPNAGFWQDVDNRIKYIADRGMVTALALDWGRDMEPELVADHQRLARYVVARYGAYPMVWITSGEYALGDVTSWGNVAQYIRSVDPYAQLVTLHNTQDNQNNFRNEAWYDIDMLQGAHTFSREVGFWKGHYDETPTKPVLESEVDYETIKELPSYTTREDAYRSFVSGSFGFTYGAEGMWNAVKSWEDTFQMWGNSPRPWYDSIDLPVGEQMRFYKDMLTSIDWSSLFPAPNAITWGSGAPSSGVYKPYQKANADNSLVVAYLPAYGINYTGVLNGLSSGNIYTAKWFNTRDGTYATISSNFSPDSNGNWNIPQQPDGRYDWVLLVKKTTNTVTEPVVSLAGGKYTGPRSVSLSCQTQGAVIYFTTDGSQPTVNSTRYTGAITVTSTATLKAVAIKSGMADSMVITQYYYIASGAVAAPVANIESGIYGSPQIITLSCPTQGATIYYTTDGTPPSAASIPYTVPVIVDRTCTLKAIAVKSGYEDSAVSGGEYRIMSKDIISRWKTITGSTVKSGTSPQNTVDGDIKTCWSPNGWSDEWIKIDLGRVYDISQVVFRVKNSLGYYYKIEVSNDNVNYTTVVDRTAIPNGDAVHANDVITRARYVKLLINGVNSSPVPGYSISVAEIDVYGANGNIAQDLGTGEYKNLAFAMPAKASSFFSASNCALNAFDQKSGSAWQAASGKFVNEWLEVDFGRNVTFNIARLSEYSNRTTGYRIEYWNGSVWQTAYTGAIIGTQAEIRFTPVTGSKARLYFVSGSYQPAIYEFQLFNVNNFSSASSFYSNDDTAWYAVDGNKDTAWQAQSGSFANVWLERDLGTGMTFNSCTLSEYGRRTDGYRIEYWDGLSWKTAYIGTEIGDTKTVNFPAVTGNKARLYFTSGSLQPIIYEFEVFNRTYNSSSIYDSSFNADKAFDNDSVTAWQAALTRFSGEWLEVDFGKSVIFNKVYLSEYGNRTTGYRIEYWDGSSWQTAYTGTSIGNNKTIEFAPVTGSRARVYFTSGSTQPIIYEFKVDTDSALLSQGELATASAYNGSNYGPDKAFDGNASTYWCAPNGAFPQWLKVDLGSMRHITSFVQRFNNSSTWKFKIEASADDITYWTVTDYTSNGLTGSEFELRFESRPARYIRLTVTGGTQWATSKEFQVYGL